MTRAQQRNITRKIELHQAAQEQYSVRKAGWMGMEKRGRGFEKAKTGSLFASSKINTATQTFTGGGGGGGRLSGRQQTSLDYV